MGRKKVESLWERLELVLWESEEFLLWVWKSNLRTQKRKHLFIVGFKENWKKWEGNCGRVFSLFFFLNICVSARGNV
jgi:hypothetical protein